LDTVLGVRAKGHLPQRVRQSIEKQQVQVEILIGWVQMALVVFFIVLYIVAPKTSEGTPFTPVSYVLAPIYQEFHCQAIGAIFVRGRKEPVTSYTCDEPLAAPKPQAPVHEQPETTPTSTPESPAQSSPSRDDVEIETARDVLAQRDT
jgi:hypothetical protein